MKKFESVAANEKNPKWEQMISRKSPLNKRNGDIRTEFERDYTRILYSTAYRRLKHKAQIYFSPESDHICTRIEHVNYVESISYTIANVLGLNTELTKAISIAHDLGHSPFGHAGEKILNDIMLKEVGESFWHEKNGLDSVDNRILLENHDGNKANLNLTYAVRDGIISHCGETNDKVLFPRNEAIELEKYEKPNQYMPYTWEGCVVKIADNISYLGRDIEDAITLGILDEHLEKLYEILGKNSDEIINNTVIINDLIYDLCQNSSQQKGLCFSDEKFELMKEIKKFNYKNIYFSDRIKPSSQYFKIVINQIYDTLKNTYKGNETIENMEKMKRFYPKLVSGFKDWLAYYWDLPRKEYLKNDVIFQMEDEKSYVKAIIYYIAGMTDNYAIEMYNEIIGF